MEAVLAMTVGLVGCSTTMCEGHEGHVEERIVSGPHALIVPGSLAVPESEPRQPLQKHVDRLRQPGGGTEWQQVEISNDSTAAEECHPEQNLFTAGPGAVAMQLSLEPLHQLVGPFELAGPDRQTKQHQWDAARTRDGAADEAEGDEDETEEANSGAIDSKLPLVLPDLATPTPAVLLRFDEDVMVMLLVIVVAVAADLPSIVSMRQGHSGEFSVTGAVAFDAG